MERVPVVCFPFAGAGAGVFRRCREEPSDLVRVCAVQLPGREERFGERLYTDVTEAVDGLLPQVLELIAGNPTVAMFGHSLGAVLAYEMAHRVDRLDGVTLARLFVSGSPDPWTRREVRATGLSDEAFLDQVRQFAGYTHPALEIPELREILMPALRADVEMHEAYLAPSEEPLSAPITSVRGGADELVSARQAAGWSQATTGDCREVELPGNHMYLVDSPVELVRLMERELARDLVRS